MAAPKRPLTLYVSLVLAAILTAGCNILSLPFFIFGPEPRIEARLKKLASDDKEVKVVILTYGGLPTHPEYIGLDRELTELLAKNLKEATQYNKEKVAIVSPNKVEKFKQDHPGWHAMDLPEIGKRFDADYVINLEINSLSLYERGSSSTLYRGRAEISVTLVDVNNPEEGRYPTEVTEQYPGEAEQPLEVGNSNPLVFRRAFLNHVAKRLAWHFTSHPTSDDYRSQ